MGTENTVEIVKHDQDPKWLAKKKEQDSFLATIERIAKLPDVPVEKFDAILRMQERIMDRKNQEDFNLAMNEVQNEIQLIVKTKDNQGKGKYAPLEDVIQQTKPLYTEKGFSLMYYEEDSHKEDHVRVCCDVMHKNGHYKKVHVDMAVQTKGAKGTQMMTTIDAEASAITKGRRYLMCMIFNIPTADDDGRAAGLSGDFISDDKVAELVKLVKETNMMEGAFLKSLKVESLSELTEQGYKKALGILDARKKYR